jgi:hypothetical protein
MAAAEAMAAVAVNAVNAVIVAADRTGRDRAGGLLNIPSEVSRLHRVTLEEKLEMTDRDTESLLVPYRPRRFSA